MIRGKRGAGKSCSVFVIVGEDIEKKKKEPFRKKKEESKEGRVGRSNIRG